MATKAKTSSKETAEETSGFDLGSTLKRLEKLAGAGGYPVLTISPTKSKALLSATNAGTTVEVSLPSKIEGLSSPWNFPFTTVVTAVSNRKGTTLSFVDSMLLVKNRQFSSKLIGTEASGVPRATPPEASTCEFMLNGDLRVVMVDALAAVTLQKTLSALPDITVHLSFTKKSVSVTAFDKSQMANYHAANTTGQVFELTLPLPRAEALFRGTIGDGEVKSVDGLLFAKSGDYKLSISLPPPEEASGVPIARVLERVAQLRKMQLPREVVFKKDDLLAFLDNAKALSKSSAMLKLEVNSNGKSKVTISADGNSIEATIKSQAKESFGGYLDISYVQAILSKTKEEAVAVTMDDSVFIFRSENLVYSAVLSSPPNEGKRKKSKKAAAEGEEGDEV